MGRKRGPMPESTDRTPRRIQRLGGFMRNNLVIFLMLAFPVLMLGQDIHDPSTWPDCSKAEHPKRCRELTRQILWSTPTCKCIKNGDGKCMGISRQGPRYTRGSGTQFQFLPTCTNDCLPGFTTWSSDEQTQKEISRCYVDWDRLKRLNPQWSDPNWTP